MGKLIILAGTSLTGKTTWAKQYLLENKRAYYVSRDTERESCFGQYRMGTGKEESIITNIINSKISELLKLGDVLIDNTHLKDSFIQEIYNRFPNTDISVKYFNPPKKEELIKRNQKRFNEIGKLIPESVINSQLKQWESLSKDFPTLIFKGSKTDPRLSNKRKWMEGLPSCIICDLDGTLSLMNGRSPFDGKECINDELNDSVHFILDSINRNKMPINVILFSGRNSDNGGKEATEKWLKEKGVEYDGLYMRAEGDMRSDIKVKSDMFSEYIDGKYNVLFCVDDRDCIVHLWREMGIDCFQVYYGNF